METLIARFRAHHPAELQQPLFFADGDDALEIRLPRTHDVNGNHGGDLELPGLRAVFRVCTYRPENRRAEQPVWETHTFDLNTGEGWAEMLRTFPQEPRIILPEGTVLQNHLDEMLDIWRRSPRDPEFSRAIALIHAAAHSRPGDELTPEQTGAINECMGRTRMRMPVRPEDTREVERILRKAGL